MKLNVLTAYNNPYSNSLSDSLASTGLAIGKENIQNKEKETLAMTSQNSNDEILTKKERSFFKKLFPENSEQIDKHILFNRNGKIQSSTVSKGTIFDGRI